MRWKIRCLVALTALLPLATPAAGAEIGATHLVFEKAAKMKKIEAALYLTFQPGADRALSCGVVAVGKNGPLAVAGAMRLALVGEADDGGEVWRSATAQAPVDGNGRADFDAAAISDLAAAAASDGADAALAQVSFKGGKGGKVSELTIDCVYDRSSA